MIAEGSIDPADAVRALAEGVVTGAYRFRAHKAEDEHELASVTIVGSGTSAETDGLAAGVAVGEAVWFARDLVNEPGGVVTPSEFANRVAERAAVVGVECEVLDRAADSHCYI